MSSVAVSNNTLSAFERTGKAENLEGNWSAYQFHISDAGAFERIRATGMALPDYKRKCALLYLGRRAQANGGVFRASTPRILNEQFSAELAMTNQANRNSRHPWLEKLSLLVAEVEWEQEHRLSGTNVFAMARQGEPALTA